jgi:hypothetical protein
VTRNVLFQCSLNCFPYQFHEIINPQVKTV